MASAIRPISALGDQALESKFAALPEQVRPDLAGLIGCNEDAVRPSRQQSCQIGLAQGQGQAAQVLTVERQDVKRVELHLFVVLARVQRLEVGHAVDTEHHGLTIDDELPETVLQCGFDDPRIAVGPVVTASCDQATARTAP